MSDLRYALRTLRASPGLTLTATLTLGLGIGATTTIFTWADALVLHPFPLVHEPARLVWVRLRGPSGALENVVSYPDYLDWREQARSFEGGLVATRIDAFGLRQPGQGSQAERVWGMLVSANYFDVLGVRPLLGRGFAPEDASRPVGAPVVVISDALWRRRFGADPGIVGKEILLNNHSLTLIGVAPARFRGTTAALGFDLWTPLTMQPVLGAYSKLESRRERWLEVFGRLGPGVGLEQARAQLRAISLR
ncbi:MAG: permease, partial [Gemmatimonadetes bacterium]